MTTTDVLGALLQRDDEHVALTLVNGRERRIQWSFSELQTQRLYCQMMLQSCDVEAGDSVVVITHNLPQFFALLLATMALDVCLLPLHPDFARDQVLDIVGRHKPRVIIVDDQVPLPTWLAHSSPSLFRMCSRDQNWLREVLDTPLQPSRAPVPVCVSSIEDRALLLFHSSGTTGQPKAMRYTRRMLNTFVTMQRQLYAAFPDQPGDLSTPLSDRVNVLPVTHWGGLCFCLQALLEGRTLHLLRSVNPMDHLQLLRDTNCQMLLLVPAVVTELLSSTAGDLRLPALHHCLTMGESVSTLQLEQLSRRLGVRVQVAYGMSECLSGLAHHRELLPETPPGSCGRLAFGEVKLVGEDGHEHPRRGELWICNETTVPCYLDPSLVRQKYVERWYRTGDVFERDAAGYYFFQGRIDAMCVINGRNIFPREVEEVLLQHGAVSECVVAPVRVRDGKQRLAAMVVLARNKTVDATSLLDFYLQQGAVFATPVCVEFCKALPRNAGDKYDRLLCALTLQAAYDRRQPLAAPPVPVTRSETVV